MKEFNKTSTTEQWYTEFYSIQKVLSRCFSLLLLRVIFVNQAECLSYSSVYLILPLLFSEEHNSNHSNRLQYNLIKSIAGMEGTSNSL